MNRRRTGRILVGSCAAALGLIPLDVAASSNESAVVEGDGCTVVTPGGDEARLSGGARVALGTTVRAGSDAFATIAIAPGVRVRLAPRSSATLGAMGSLPAEHPGAKRERAISITLTSGEADVEAQGGALGVTMLLPHGASFSMWRGAGHVGTFDDHAAVALYDGMAIAGSNEKWKQIAGGNGALLAQGQPPALRPVPSSPAWAAGAPASFALVHSDAATRLALQWSGDGASYDVELARDAHMIDARPIGAPTTPSFDLDLKSGSYYARVRARSAEGIEGPASAPRPLRVVRASLPTAATVGADGAIVIPASSSITLDDPRDLEIAMMPGAAWPAAPHWAPASRQIRLGGDRMRTVHLRDPRIGAEAKLVLARRELRARVTMTPKNARWPEDPIDIVIEAEDPSGQIDPTRETLVMDSHVNLDAAPLTWSREGATWRAHVAPHVPPGPWVVRVDVHDSTGSEIGAAFLEVEGPRIERTTQKIADTTQVRVMQ